jgi:hypothetical protein
MCNFFSCVSDGHGSIRYFGAKERTELNNFNPKHYEFDSHSSICNYFEINEDKCNKYEYNPFTKKFVVDRLNNTDDSAHVEKQVRNLDFTDIFETGLFDIDLSKLESLDGIELPKKYQSINLYSLEKLENFVFPENCEFINLDSCKRIKNVRFPKNCTKLCLSSLESLDGIELPEKCKSINLSSLEKLENFVFPEECYNIDLESCTELKNVILPKECDYLDLSSLKSLENVTFPKKLYTLYLNSIESKDFEIPEKHGVICFKDKNVNSNF